MTQDPSWKALAEEFEKLKQSEGQLRACWWAYEGAEDCGAWILVPGAKGTAGGRALFTLTAAHAIAKLGIAPIPIPAPEQHDPQWKLYCEVEEDFARREGKSKDLSNAIPYGLGELDRDAVDPCTRGWLELLRRESPSFLSSEGSRAIRGVAYRTFDGSLADAFDASATYCLLRARDEIEERLSRRTEQGVQPSSPARLSSGAVVPEPRRTTLEAELRNINSNLIERGIDKEKCLRLSYDAFAKALSESGKALLEVELTERIPELVFKVALEFSWLTLEQAERSSYYWIRPSNYRNPAPIPEPDCTFGSQIVQESFKQWLMAGLKGRVEFWRGELLKKSLDQSDREGAHKKKRGRRPDRERRSAIFTAIAKHGANWRECLDEIFNDLDTLNVQLGEFREWVIDLGDGHTQRASCWSDVALAAGDQRRKLIDALRKYEAKDRNPPRI